MLEYCPTCLRWRVRQQPPEEAEELYQMLNKYYEVGGGIVWAPPTVKFDNKDSADKFEAAASKMIHTRWCVSFFVEN